MSEIIAVHIQTFLVIYYLVWGRCKPVDIVLSVMHCHVQTFMGISIFLSGQWASLLKYFKYIFFCVWNRKRLVFKTIPYLLDYKLTILLFDTILFFHWGKCKFHKYIFWFIHALNTQSDVYMTWNMGSLFLCMYIFSAIAKTK